MKRALTVLLALTVHFAAAAPQPPGSDIWLADLTSTDGRVKAGAARNLTSRPGYDNQPAFVTNQSLLFTSMDAAGQTDAWRYDLASGDARAVLVTPESEYSPTPAPGGDMSVVRVSLQGVQQLWLLPAGGAQYEVLFPMLEGVGYHAWLDDDNVALFMIPPDNAPMELHIANRRTGSVTVMAKGIGRSLQSPPGSVGSVAFVEDGHDDRRWIKRLDFEERRIVPLAPVPGRGEDFVFLPDGRLLLAQEKTVFIYDDERWREIATFDALPGMISRLAVSPNGQRLAMVVDE